MLNEILVILIVISVVYFMFIKKPSLRDKKTTKKDELNSEDLVACHTCGTYISVSESIIKGADYYCSQECLEG